MFSSGSSSVTIGSSWTRGLAVHPVGMHSLTFVEYYLAKIVTISHWRHLHSSALVLVLAHHRDITRFNRVLPCRAHNSHRFRY
jgi:hypothetical protein